MEMQAIKFRDRVYCTVFVVQQNEVTVLNKFSGSQSEVREWLHKQSFPSSGHLLLVKDHQAIPEGFYINPGLGPVYYQVDAVTDGLYAASPQAFHVPAVLENL